MKRAASVLSPSVARYSTMLTRDVALVRVSRGFVSLQPTRSMVPRSVFAVSRRLFASQSPQHYYSRTICHPCLDGIFQYGFGSHTALTNFLNAALDLKGETEIQQVEHIKKDMPTADPPSLSGYHFTVDVRCRTKDGHHFLVEMQNDFRDDYHMKALAEHSRMVSLLDTDQTQEDKDKRAQKSENNTNRFWTGIEGIYTIVITNKGFDSKSMKVAYPAEKKMEPLLVNPYELRHTEQLDRHYGHVPNRIILLMLDHLNKPVAELKTPIEDWAYVLKEQTLRKGAVTIPVTKELQEIELIANRNPGIREFIERIDVKNLPNQVRDRHMRAIQYYNTTIIDIEEKAVERGIEKGKREGLFKAIEKGKREGLFKGIEKGKREGLLKGARVLKELKTMSHAEIAIKLDLTEADVSGIKID